MTERYPPMALEAMNPAQRAVAEAILSGPRGQIQGPFNVLLRAPNLADHVQRVGAHLRWSGAMDGALREIAILTVSRRWASQFEWFAHHPIAMGLGVDAGAAERLRQGQDPVFPVAAHQLVWRLSDRILDAGRLDDAMFAEGTKALGDESMVELLTVLGYYTLLSFILNVGQVPVPGDEPFPGADG